MTNIKKKNKNTLLEKEKKLGLILLLPTILIVLSIVIFPLLANFWISFKPVSLGDLRPPTLIIKERIKGKLSDKNRLAEIQYRYRNSSIKYDLENVIIKDIIPNGFTVKDLQPAQFCRLKLKELTCNLNNVFSRSSGKIILKVHKNEQWQKELDNPKKTKPLVTFSSKNVLTSFEFSTENFKKVFSASEFFEVLKVSFYYTIFGTAGALLVGLLAAQILQKSFRGRSIVRGLLLFPYVSPVIAVAFAWVILFDPFSGIVNSMLVQMNVIDKPINFFGQKYTDIIIFGYVFKFPLALSMVIAFEIWRYFPLSFLFILARMQSFPEEVYDAAKIDGASPFQQFYYISLPFLIGIMSILFLLRFIWTFNKFDDIFLLTGGAAGTKTLTVDVYETGFNIGNLGTGAANAVLVFLILVFAAIFIIRFSPKE